EVVVVGRALHVDFGTGSRQVAHVLVGGLRHRRRVTRLRITHVLPPPCPEASGGSGERCPGHVRKLPARARATRPGTRGSPHTIRRRDEPSMYARSHRRWREAMAYRLWTIDPGHSTIELSTKHMMFTTVRGRFKGFSGELHLDREEPDRSWCEVTIMTASIDTADPDRDAHLRSADFCAAEAHPEIRFRSKEVMGARPDEGARFR